MRLTVSTHPLSRHPRLAGLGRRGSYSCRPRSVLPVSSTSRSAAGRSIDFSGFLSALATTPPSRSSFFHLAQSVGPIPVHRPRTPRAFEAVRHPGFGRLSSLTHKPGGGLTPACSGLAALAADARRWAAPTSHLAFIGALSLSYSSFGSSGRRDRSSRSVGSTCCSLESAGRDGRPHHRTSIPCLASSPLSAGGTTVPAFFPRLCASHFTRSVLTSHGVRLHPGRCTGCSASRQPLESFVFVSHLEEHQLRIAAPGTNPVYISPRRHLGHTWAHPSRRPTPACSGLATLAADARR